MHAQDKAVMRERLAALGVPCPRNARGRRRRRTSTAFGFPCVLKTTRGGYDGKGVWFVDAAERVRRRRSRPRRRPAYGSWPRSWSTSGASCRRWWPARPSGQAAAYPVVESVQRDGICREVVAPAPDLDPALAGAGAADRAADRRRARRHRHPRRRAVRDHRRPGAGQRARDAPAQHRALDPGRRGHLQFENHLRAVLDLPLGSPGAAGAVDGDGQHPRRRRRDAAGCTTATRTRWPATRGCGCTSTARTLRPGPQGRPRQRLRRRPRRLPRARPARRRVVRAATWETRASEHELSAGPASAS